jgi:hypothetical protein
LACDFCLAISFFFRLNLTSTTDTTTNPTETIYHLDPSILLYRYGLDYDLHHISITYNALYNPRFSVFYDLRDLDMNTRLGDAVSLSRSMRFLSQHDWESLLQRMHGVLSWLSHGGIRDCKLEPGALLIDSRFECDF